MPLARRRALIATVTNEAPQAVPANYRVMQSRARPYSSGAPRQSGTACGEQTARSKHLASSGFPAHLGARLSRLTPRQSASSHNLYVTNTIINAALTPSPGHMSLVARMGHDNERAALFTSTKHAAPTPPLPTRSTLTLSPSRPMLTIRRRLRRAWRPWANGTLMARGRLTGYRRVGYGNQRKPLTWRFVVERVTGIESALSAWESDRSRPTSR